MPLPPKKFDPNSAHKTSSEIRLGVPKIKKYNSSLSNLSAAAQTHQSKPYSKCVLVFSIEATVAARIYSPLSVKKEI